jgi:hypothetical protein
MNKTLKLFSLLFMLIFSMVSADTETEEDKFRSWVFEKYRLTVTEVDPELHCFKLSNKLVYNIPKKNWETDALPEVGDRVVLTPIIRLHSHRSTHIEQGELCADIRGPDGKWPSKRKVNVWVSGESEYQLYFVDVDLVRTDSGWISDVYEDVVLLSDRLGWIRKSKEPIVFAPGDRIIVSKNSKNEYILIDLDQNFRFETSNGKTFGMLAYEVVEPFIPAKITKE